MGTAAHLYWRHVALHGRDHGAFAAAAAAAIAARRRLTSTATAAITNGDDASSGGDDGEAAGGRLKTAEASHQPGCKTPAAATAATGRTRGQTAAMKRGASTATSTSTRTSTIALDPTAAARRRSQAARDGIPWSFCCPCGRTASSGEDFNKARWGASAATLKLTAAAAAAVGTSGGSDGSDGVVNGVSMAAAASAAAAAAAASVVSHGADAGGAATATTAAAAAAVAAPKCRQRPCREVVTARLAAEAAAAVANFNMAQESRAYSGGAGIEGLQYECSQCGVSGVTRN